jgi:hypothetical protein
MNQWVILDCVFIAGCLILVFVPLDKKRIRVRWANYIFVATGLIGITVHVLQLMLEMHWLVLANHADYRVWLQIRFFNGLLLGFLLTLTFSGQLLGIKRQEQ